MRKTLLAVALTALCSSAFAATPVPPSQSASSYVANHGNISNSVSSSASVNGAPGTSYSQATGTAGAASSGYAITDFSNQGVCNTHTGDVAIGGVSSTFNSGTAFNVSTGAGTGSASTRGWADSDVVAGASYSGPAQWVSVAGSSDSGHQNNALGTDISVVAGKNQGGGASASTNGAFSAVGGVGSTICTTCNLTVKSTYGFVNDAKSTTSTASTGSMTVNGVLLNQAPANAQASTVVNVNGGYGDPI